eukprot:3273471-Amphidinium_carterae.1
MVELMANMRAIVRKEMVAGFSGVNDKREMVARDAASAVETAEKARRTVQKWRRTWQTTLGVR